MTRSASHHGAPERARLEEHSANLGRPGEDPFLWLEDIEGNDALRLVKERNAKTEAVLRTDRRLQIESGILEILDSQERIPTVVQRGEYLYNFWTDAGHERGIWRRTTWESYRSDTPEWDMLIDVDALGAAEGVKWVWKGANVLYPSRDRALVSLSRGGSDADVTREFDLTTREFIEDGFFREESKGGITWADTTGATTFVFTDTGEGSLTRSGYPRTVRQWTRGTPLESSELVYEGETDDMYIGAAADHTPGFERSFVQRAIAFYETEVFELREGELRHIPVPSSADASVWREWLLIHLRDPWVSGEATYPADALLAIGYEDFLAGSADFTMLFTPGPHVSLAALTVTRHHVVVTVLEDVVNRLEILTPPARTDTGADDDGGWRRRALDLDVGDGGAAIERFATISVSPVDQKESDELWVSTQGFLTPSTLSLLTLDDGGNAVSLESLKSLPAFFDAEGMEVTQHFATSKDGTRIPYFQVAPAGFTADGTTPTILYGYGGFEVSLLPGYNPAMGRAWLARGGVYVVANIRGGGEYGPAWHQAALKQNRRRAYEDFAAVARDLVDRGVTAPDRLGAQGASNGGLLVTNMLTQYPELFGAIVCQVPLTDMKRYSHMLAGASWMAEYGDPDDPEQWEYIRTFSPYHLAEVGRDYPPVLFTTSTRDDRVHPGHARKMAAKLAGMGYDVTYWENIEGGHGGAATSSQRARMSALAYEFLWQRLG
ncbi:MAG TPA: prolyl oligopeptidase family serine peptidase [Actinomycetaceae bacterium]|nr:prolyl oligopeptidase family serine peptidase [Actinomycetaceae bacterium]